MYGNISYDLLGIVAKGKQEDLLREAQHRYLVDQIIASQKPKERKKTARLAWFSINPANFPRIVPLKDI